MIYNMEAEQTFLGSLIMDPDLVKETRIKPDQLSQRHSIILQTMQQVTEKGMIPDLVAIVTQMGNSLVEQIGGVTYLSKLADSVPTLANFRQTESFIVDAYKLRSSREVTEEFMKSVHERSDPILIADMMQKLTEIDDIGQVPTRSWRDVLSDIVEESFLERKGLSGMNTGYNELNAMTDGLQGNNLIILGARPSMGKTAFALNIGVNAAILDDARVDIFSLETPEDRLAKRIISATGNIDAYRLKTMQFDDATRKKFMDTVGFIDGLDINIHDSSFITVEEIRSIVRDGNKQAKKEGKKHIVLIDYLQLITYVGPLNNPVQQVGHISRQLKIMAGDFKIPVIALSQLSRGVESRQDKRPMMSDIRESGSIEQDADIVAFLYRDDYYDKESENQNITEVIIAKNRDGAVGTVELAFIKEYNKFVNLDRRQAA
ncbi:replicative DNA helicase [Bacillus phage vB_BpsM-61]|nr:replicative DNA helicase [Bacillus phage vB_BpsM-61]